MLRIALVHPHLNGISGVELHHAGLCRFLTDRGHDVHVYGDPRTSDISLAPGVTFHAVRAPEFRETRLGLAWYVREFAREASRVVAGDRALYDVVHARGEVLVAPDIYHVTGIQWGERHRALASRNVGETGPSRRVKDALHPIARPVSPVLARLERRILRDPRLQAVHAEGRFVHDDLVAHYSIDPALIEVIPPPVDTDRFQPAEDRTALRAQLGLPDSHVLILFSGHDFARKGLAKLIDALARMREQVTLVVVGGGAHQSGAWTDETRRPYRERAASLGVDDRVIFVGATTDIEQFTAAADIYALPTSTDMFAATIIEAMACGVPPVTTDGAGASVEIDHGSTGFVLRTPVDVGELAATLDLLAADRDLRESIGRAARAKAHELSTQAIFAKVEASMRDVARRRSLSAG